MNQSLSAKLSRRIQTDDSPRAARLKPAPALLFPSTFAIAAMLFAHTGAAQDGTFLSGTALWSGADSWQNGTLPTGIANIVNNGTAQIVAGDNINLTELKDGNAGSSGSVVQTGGLLTVNGWTTIAHGQGSSTPMTGAYTITSGTLAKTGGGWLQVGDGGGSGSTSDTGILTVAGSGTVTVSDPSNWAPLYVGVGADLGTVNVQGNGQLLMGNGDIDIGAANHDGGSGTLNISGGTASAKYFFGLGSNGGAGTLNLSGSGTVIKSNSGDRFSMANQGDNNTAILNQSGGILQIHSDMSFGGGSGNTAVWNFSGGSATIDSWLHLYAGANGSNTINLSGSANLTVTGVSRIGSGAATSSTSALIQSGGAANYNGELWVGNGGTGYYTQSGGTLNANSWANIGQGGGTGVFDLQGGVLNKSASGSLIVGADGSAGTLTQTGGLVNGVGELWVGQAGGSGTYALSSGTLNAQNWTVVGRSGGSGTFNLTGGVFNKTGSGTLIVGSGGIGALNQSGGVLQVANDTWLGESGTGSWSISGGTASLAGLYVGQSGAALGTLTLSGSGSVSATNVYLGSLDTAGGVIQLNGGTLAANALWIHDGGGSGTTHQVNFNGGVLQALSDNASFVNGFNPGDLNVKAGGATIDTNTHSITVGAGFTEDNGSTGGGLVKSGAGTLILAGTNTYGGGTTVNGGVLKFGTSEGAVPAVGTVTLHDGGALAATGPSGLGSAPEWLGSGKIAAGSSGALALTADETGNLDFSAGGYDNLALGSVGNTTYGGFITPGANGFILGGGGGTLTLNSSLIAAAPLTVKGNVTLAVANAFSGTVTVAAGTLSLAASAAIPGNDVTVSGGTLNVGSQSPMFGALRLTAGTVSGDTGVITSGSDFQVESGTVAATLGGFSGLVKSTAGTVTLSKAATYAGATAITAGTLKLAGFVLPQGAAAYYSFGDAGNLFKDYSGNGSDLQLGAGSVASLSTGPNGSQGSMAFGGYLVTRSGLFPTNVPTGNSAYTIAAWVNLTNDNNNGIAGWGNYGAGGQVNAFRTQGSGTLVNYWWSNDFGAATPSTMNGNWAYVAATYDPASNTRTLYFDGAVLGSDHPGPAAVTGTNFRVGATNLTEYFSGCMADLLISNAALTQAQLQAAQVSEIQNNLLPTSTAVLLSAGATLDLGGARQAIGSLADGAGGGTVTNSTAMPSVLTVGNDNTSTGFSGNIANGIGGVSLVKIGTGALTLSGSNSYTGDTTVNGGTLLLGSVQAVKAGNNVTVAGGVLDLDGQSPAFGAVALTGGTIQGAGAISATAPYDLQDGVVSATLGGSVGLNKSGPGAVTLSGSNTFTGLTTVSNGTLVYGSANAIRPGNDVTVSGGALDVQNQTPTFGTVVLAGGTIQGSGAITANQAYDLRSGSVGVALGGSVGLTKSTEGTVVITGAVNTTGTATIAGGVLQVGSGGTGGSLGSSPVLVNGGILRAGNANAFGSGALNVAVGAVDLIAAGGSGNVTVSAGSLSGAGKITDNADGIGTSVLEVTQSVPGAFSGVINDGATRSLALSVTGAAPLTLDGGGNFTGGTTIGAGARVIASKDGLPGNSPLGTGPVTLSGGTLVLGGQQTLVSGLSVSLYNDPAQPYVNGQIPAFNTLSGLSSYVGALTPSVTARTTDSGMTTLYTAHYGGHLFGAYGFNQDQNYDAVFKGLVNIATPGTYTFDTWSDDGSVLFIDGNNVPVVNNNYYQGATTRFGSVALGQGLHSITIGYYQAGAGSEFAAGISGPDSTNTADLANSVLFTASQAASQSWTNNLLVTNDSTLAVANSSAATVGALSINSSTLTVTGTAAAPFSLTLGPATVSGSATIQVAASGTVTLGSVTESGGPQSLTKAGNGTLILSGSAAISQLNANGGTTQIDNSITLQALSVGTNGTVSLAAHTGSDYHVLDTSELSIAGNGTLDIGNQADLNQALLKVTYVGDFNADGVIDSSDYALLDTYAQAGSTLGDLSGDGLVGSSDYGPLDTGYQNQVDGVLSGAGGSASAQPSAANSSAAPTSPESVPEPETWGLMAGGLGLLLKGRRRRTVF